MTPPPVTPAAAKPAALRQILEERPYRFDFFQAVRLLEWLARETADDGAARRPVGEDAPPADEIVRFHVPAALAFPPGTVSNLRANPAGGGDGHRQAAWDLETPILGLIGPSGVLPQHYTAAVIARVRNKDEALARFLDLFQHRTLSLFWRAWNKYRFAMAFEHQAAQGLAGEDLFTQVLYALVGSGTKGLRRRQRFDDETLLYFAGHFSHFPRSADAIERMLADYFRLPVEIRQFQGQWLQLEDEDCSRFSSPACPGGRNLELGRTLLVGQRVWDVQSRFRIRVGPLTYPQFRTLMPSGRALGVLADLARRYVGVHLEFDVQLVLAAPEVPRCRLGGDGSDPSYLGWNTWIRAGEFVHDVDDAVFLPRG